MPMCGPIHYVRQPGDGPPLLLLHGVTRCWRDWEPMFAELKANWSVVAADHLGHGDSQRSESYFVTDYAAAAEVFLRGSFDEPITIMGHSLGAMVALALAANCPQHVKRVILEDPPFHTMGEEIDATPYQTLFQGMYQLALRGGDLDSLTQGMADIVVPMASGRVRLGDIRDRSSLRSSATFLRQIDPQVLVPLATGHWLDGFFYRTLWSRVECPILLLQGDNALGGALSDQDVEHARAESSRLAHHRFDGVGHQIHGNRPLEVVRALRQFADDA